jgi:hypothetical protein
VKNCTLALVGGAVLSEKHREALEGQLEALLELAKGAALSLPKGD